MKTIAVQQDAMPKTRYPMPNVQFAADIESARGASGSQQSKIKATVQPTLNGDPEQNAKVTTIKIRGYLEPIFRETYPDLVAMEDADGMVNFEFKLNNPVRRTVTADPNIDRVLWDIQSLNAEVVDCNYEVIISGNGASYTFTEDKNINFSTKNINLKLPVIMEWEGDTLVSMENGSIPYKYDYIALSGSWPFLDCNRLYLFPTFDKNNNLVLSSRRGIIDYRGQKQQNIIRSASEALRGQGYTVHPQIVFENPKIIKDQQEDLDNNGTKDRMTQSSYTQIIEYYKKPRLQPEAPLELYDQKFAAQYDLFIYKYFPESDSKPKGKKN